MAYDRVNWEDAPSTKTPISAENLNKMDAGILANDKKLQKAISIKQEVDDSAQNIDSTLMESLPAATAAEDADILIIENATKTQKITWGTIINLIKTKLGIGTASNLQTASKEIVGAVNELNSKSQDLNICRSSTTSILDTVKSMPQGRIYILYTQNADESPSKGNVSFTIVNKAGVDHIYLYMFMYGTIYTAYVKSSTTEITWTKMN